MGNIATAATGNTAALWIDMGKKGDNRTMAASWYGGGGGAGNFDGTDGGHAAKGAIFRKTGIVGAANYKGDWGGDYNFPVMVWADNNKNGKWDAGEKRSVAYLGDTGGAIHGGRIDLSHKVANQLGGVEKGRFPIGVQRFEGIPAVNSYLSKGQAQELDRIGTKVAKAIDQGKGVDQALGELFAFQFKASGQKVPENIIAMRDGKPQAPATGFPVGETVASKPGAPAAKSGGDAPLALK
jgi:hypothetical protein